MNLLRSLPLALFSLFTIHVHTTSGSPDWAKDHSQVTIDNNPPKGTGYFKFGPGPQKFPETEQKPKTPPPAPLPRHFAWDANLPIDKGNVVIVNVQTGDPAYKIFQVPDDHRTFNITNMHGDQLLSVTFKEKAHRGHNFRYHTPSGVSYRITPRGFAKTDRWYMTMEGNAKGVDYQTLKYFRGHSKNAGNVNFSNSTRAASFEFKPADKSHWKVDTLRGVSNTVQLEITAPTNIGDHYFIGLWALVKIRIDKWGL
ncbi:hypothetical protein MJO28_006478 [Puccinia striiformis f. sp. tritici]|uniref:Glycoside hydrolase 131 catalytic N-terminal domain-containing protein n=3 Tax=Puccinia striiformis TaxID=27350 RepID=A0A0L0VIQ0_9BASI|nr:hypothetical protein Pst134EA_011653 [Puccinia striiformis f. sp. tritici]KAI9605241.1 hypothetical protein H4Q26_003219 [Puccinia striiformis f. sp. tritici PST-130]KNE99138.1 hypothetical protein PSTG_07617 [Puccinia striiformis f. sp. tritici PST-78]POW01277.1 hypothetical protein PSTT_12592 [Puccinia striiformis]KAH9456424.1 hypothetical protein Pst134EB_012621 [Puccinia striiformis f. sp. tritici]KAH9468032.1 hypothetical protein Pst134EA_011653 [Puccinia striiformis f. sp. tritici]